MTENNERKKRPVNMTERLFIKLPGGFLEKLDKHIGSSNGYYESRSNFVRVAITEKIKKDNTNLTRNL